MNQAGKIGWSYIYWKLQVEDLCSVWYDLSPIAVERTNRCHAPHCHKSLKKIIFNQYPFCTTFCPSWTETLYLTIYLN